MGTKASDETTAEERELYRDCCAVVRHLATEIARIHEQGSVAMNLPRINAMLPQVYATMQVLGDWHNNHDTVEDDDEWVNPVFERINAWAAANDIPA